MVGVFETTRGYRELIVWQKAMDLIPVVYALARTLPSAERFGLAGQMQRAAVSVAANIAEEQARHHPKDFFRHLSIARGSLAELDTLMLSAIRLGFLTETACERADELIVETRRLLQRLMQSIPR